MYRSYIFQVKMKHTKWSADEGHLKLVEMKKDVDILCSAGI